MGGDGFGLITGAAPADSKTFGVVTLVVQVLLLIGLAFTEYDSSRVETLDSSSIYNFYVGVALMMFVGFGYLMTFLKAYGLGAVGFTMYITCIGVEFAMIVENLMVGHPYKLDFMDLLNANFAVAAVLISFGGLIKISPMQILIVILVELVCYCANKVFLLTNLLAIADCGGTIIIHVFGAYFGLAACATLGPALDEQLNGSSYNSDIFSLVGTVFLWLFWPSFVAGNLEPGSVDQSTALFNTVLALLGSTVVTFGLMPLISKGRLGTVPVQNATLAGGVSIGATANLVMGPFAACLIGSLAGALSCFFFVNPIIPSTYDTCGIHNLHGMPGILGGLVSVVLPLLVADTGVNPLKQLLGLVGTLAVAGVTGAVTGLILKAVGQPGSFDDETFWDCADDKPKAS
jgi:ammonium transporter Rh